MTIQVMQDQRQSARSWARAFDTAASATNDQGRRLSIAATVLTTLVSTAIFVSLSADDVEPIWKAVTGAVSAVAAIISAVVAALGSQDRAAGYRKAALQYTELKCKADRLMAGDVTEADLEEVEADRKKVAEHSPIIPTEYYTRAEEHYTAQDRDTAGQM